MAFPMPHLNQVDRTATVFRLLTVMLAGLALLLSEYPADPLLLYIGAGYVVTSGALALLDSRVASNWTAYPIVLLDIGVVTAINTLAASPLPLWPLYLFPIAGAAVVGQSAAATAIALSVVSYSTATWLTTGSVSVLDFWPITILVAATFLIATLSAHWLVGREAKQRILTPSAAEAIAHAATVTILRGELRREVELRRTAAEMTATLDRQTVYTITTAAARSGLGASASLVELSSGRILAGDSDVSPALMRLAVEGEAVAGEWITLLPEEGHPLRVLVGTDLALLVRRPDPPLGLMEATWLDQLAALAKATLDRCRSYEQLQAQLQVKEDLIATVGHELRSPLTSIHGYSQMMSRELGIVQRQVGQLNRLIGDMVDASRLEDGQLPIKRETIHLAEYARMAAERFRGAYEGRKLRLELSDVPSIQGDPARLNQVLDNLLGNAVKYSPPDQEVVLRIEATDGRVLLSVQDHGTGIAPEHLPHLFDRFYRAPCDSTRRVKGLGLGLSIVRDLVAAHGGSVWAESAGPGQGSTFWVSLPVAAREESPA